MPLKDVAVRNAKPSGKPRKLSDGGGLHVLIPPTGSKLWRLAYRFAGKQKTLALGVYPAISLEEARKRKGEAKKLLARSIDPSVQREADRQAGKDRGFRAVAEELIAKLGREGRAQATLSKKHWLMSFAYPALEISPWQRSRRVTCLRCFEKLRTEVYTKRRGGCVIHRDGLSLCGRYRPRRARPVNGPARCTDSTRSSSDNRRPCCHYTTLSAVAANVRRLLLDPW